MQERCNYIANTLELHFSCTNPSMYTLHIYSTPWWCHDMKMLAAFLAFCEGNAPGTTGFTPFVARDLVFWWFVCCMSEQTMKQAIRLPIIWDIIFNVPRIIHMVHTCICYILFPTILAISLRVNSLAVGQYYDWSCATGVILKDMEE